jgi:hypothetical protein
MDKLVEGKTFNITHCRKGSFTIKVTDLQKEWVTGEITEGHTTTLCEYNRKDVGESETIRISFLTKCEEVK